METKCQKHNLMYCQECNYPSKPTEKSVCSNELLLCPFCGGKAETGTNFGRAGVRCTECPANIRSDEICGGEDGVLKAWNRRAE